MLKGIHYFVIFVSLKHTCTSTLWAFARGAAMRQSYQITVILCLSKKCENAINILPKIVFFYAALKIIRSILHRRFNVKLASVHVTNNS